MDAFLPTAAGGPARSGWPLWASGQLRPGRPGESDVDLVVVLDALGAAGWPPAGVCWRRCPSLTGPAASSATRRPWLPGPPSTPSSSRLDTLPVYGSLEELLPPWGRRRGRGRSGGGLRPLPCRLPPPSLTRPAGGGPPPSKGGLALRLAHCRRSGQYTAARQALLPSWSRRSGPCWGRIAPCRPHGVGQGRGMESLTQAFLQTETPRRIGAGFVILNKTSCGSCGRPQTSCGA